MNDKMTSFSAKPATPMNVLFVVYPDIVLLDLVGPLQVFTHAQRRVGEGPAYQTHVASFTGGMTPTNVILQIESTPLSDWLDGGRAKPIHTLVIVGGDGAIPASADAAFVDQVRQLAQRATRVASVCSGALVLAAAGLLDGRRAVTHWEDCARLADEYPAVHVEEDPIFIRDGNVWTSAGITAGIDMALAMVEADLGKPAAMAMARSLVTPMVRSGGQSQFSATLDQQARDAEGRFGHLHDWIAQNIHRRLSVDEMARTCAMSPRNFSRRYTQTMGVSPAKAIERMRVEAAREMLASTGKAMKSVAADCGFRDDERMRRAFLRCINTSPSAYRKQFGVQAD